MGNLRSVIAERAPFRFAIDTRRLAPGPHTIMAAATDDVGNTSAPASATILVADAANKTRADTADTLPPRVYINLPTDGATVDRLGVRATVADNAALARVDWLVDGEAAYDAAITGTRAVSDFTWLADGVATGPHTISVVVFDAEGNETTRSISVIKK